jgi:D-alanyl-D-alanine carboxypeptidase (penicillin-binding protein 5/6)
MVRKSFIIILIVLLTQTIAYGDDLDLSAQSYILMEESSGRVLLEKNSHIKMPMASTTKIMTALLAVEKGDMEDTVEISEDSVNIEGSSIYLKVGEKLKLGDLVYGLMLRSGNDSAVAIANYISGTEKDFIRLMNKKARLIGANDTNFTNPHGLYDKNHYTTAYDLALITRYAFKYDEFEQVSSAKSYKSSREENNYFVNKNKTLWDYDGGDGVKIGYTMASGRCLVSSSTRSNMRLIAVALNAPDWFNDNYKLMDYGYNNYQLYNIFEKGKFIKNIKVIDGVEDKLPVVTEKEFIYPLNEDEVERIKVIINCDELAKAPVEKGDILGSIDVYLDGKIICKNKIVANNDIAKESFWVRLLPIIYKRR